MYAEILTKEFLEKKYHEEGKTKNQIAVEVGTTVTTVNKYLKKHELLSKTSGSYKSQNLTGQLFGELTAERKSGVDNHNKTRWFCRCACGDTTTVNAASLIRGLTKSCGHIKKELLNKDRVGNLSKAWWRRLVQQAACRGIEIELSPEDVWKKYTEQQGNCLYTKLPIVFSCDYNYTNKQTASVDRTDSMIGYKADNVQLIHKVVNSMKNILEHEEFVSFCNLVAMNHPRSYETCIENTTRTVLRKTRHRSG